MAVQTITTRKKAHRAKKAPRQLSRLRKPDDMSLAEWQTALRRQFGRQQRFKLKNVGGKEIFSEFEVFNPETKRTYRVAIRGMAAGENFCSCPDFAVNTLGTCKHVEFTLAKLAKKPGGKRRWPGAFNRPTPRCFSATAPSGR